MKFKELKTTYRSIEPSSLWKEETKGFLLAAMKTRFQPAGKQDIFSKWLMPVPKLALATAALVIVILFSFTFVQAKNAVPGQPLYALKRFSEKTRLFLTPSSQKPVLRAEILSNRISEARILVQEPESNERLEELNSDFQKELVALREDLKKNVRFKNVSVKEDSQIKQQEPGAEAPALASGSPIGKEVTLPVGESPWVISPYTFNDLDKILQETKELISSDNFQAALDKTKEIEEIVVEKEEEENKEENSREEALPSSETESEAGSVVRQEETQSSEEAVNPVSGDDYPVKQEQEKESEPDFQGNMFQGL